MASGLLFGVAFALMGEVSEVSGLVPVVFQRLVGFRVLMAMAVVLSVMFNADRMRWWQATGIAATAVGVSLMALGA